jgi:hypothetical protein
MQHLPNENVSVCQYPCATLTLRDRLVERDVFGIERDSHVIKVQVKKHPPGVACVGYVLRRSVIKETSKINYSASALISELT